MSLIHYLALALAGLAALYIALRAYARRHITGSEASAQHSSQSAACGLGEVCDLSCAPEYIDEPAVYFDDEELDQFAGRASDKYTEAEVGQFEYIMTTMRPTEVHVWLRSLQKRGIELPDDLKDAAYMIVSEQREG
ncbi:MAG: phospholipase [Alloprevotella sp.]|nr:phospholipase [Alloprevotella sp.]